MPLLPISTHLLSIGWKAKISRDGCDSESDDNIGENVCKIYLCVRVISWFELDLFEAHFLEEYSHETCHPTAKYRL